MNFLFLLFTLNSNADIYSWVDKKGITHYSTTPPKSDTDLELKIYPTTKGNRDKTTKKTSLQNIKSALKSVISPASQKESRKKTVELYITTRCPWCTKAISFFRGKNVELIIYDIEKDAEAAKRKNRLDSKRGVPFAVIDGKHYVHGYSESYYNEVLTLKD